MTRRDVEFRIDELILKGFGAVDGLEVAAAVERELARMLAAHGLPPAMERPRQVGVLRGEPIESGDGSAAEIGRQVGRSVYGGLSHER